MHTTLSDSLRAAAEITPQRTVLVDKDTRLDCAALYSQAAGLSNALMQRMPVGSTVSFMLPNWHEAAVIYLAATLAGYGGEPGILPSLRDHDLCFILEDVETAMIFVPEHFGGHDYAAMLERVTAAMQASPPEGGGELLRGEASGSHTSVSGAAGAGAGCRQATGPGSRRRADGPLHVRHHRGARKAFCCRSLIRYMRWDLPDPH